MLSVAGIRYSTLLMIMLLVSVALAKRNWRGVVAAGAFLFGFEAVYRGTAIALTALGHPRIGGGGIDVGILIAVVGWVACVWWAHLGASRLWITVTVALWLVWLAMGFYSNLHGVILSWPNEAINVAAKTAFGMIYLVPLAIERKNTLAEPPPA